MDQKELEQITELIQDYKNQSNKDLEKIMDFISNEFETTKEKVISLTHYLDKLENTYNVILKEHSSRNGNK
jgi:hypothetical protein